MSSYLWPCFCLLLSMYSLSLFPQLPVGRESICHYRVMHRNPVFSHDELICKLIMQPDQLELYLLNSAMEDAKRMVKEETKLRSALNEMVCAVSD